MSDALVLVVAALAVHRLTVLITWDSITDPLREYVVDIDWLYTLVSCVWCAGFWISLGMTAFLAPVLGLSWLLVLLLPFAFSSITGLLEAWRLR